MGLTTIAFPENRPKCFTEGCNNLAAPSGEIRKDGKRYYVKNCRGCQVKRVHGRRNALKKPWHRPGRSYLLYRKEYCQSCGFLPKDMCQLDVDHIDGNRKNNDLSNLQTLCANCHRLKTKLNKDSLNLSLRLK